MDIRGIEVTNQLRSAIRAKLLELGVRYDEELPDYILVMVVNKKSRQQMHEDLYLFLEDCTTPFVDWLHDQVLKKLQKVTVAKKKSREFVPTVVVKQEEEKKKRKTSTTSFLEDQAAEQIGEKSLNKNTKDDKSFHKQSTKSSTSTQNLDLSHNKNVEKCVKNSNSENRSNDTLIRTNNLDTTLKKAQQNDAQNCNTVRDIASSELSTNGKSGESRKDVKTNDTSTKSLKRPLDTGNNYHENPEKKSNEAKRSKTSEEKDDPNEDSTKKLKSCVNRPKITSVVSVKNRLGVISPRKKFEIYREKAENESRHRQLDKRFEKHRFEASRNSNSQKTRNFEIDERSKRNRETESRYYESDKSNDIKNRLGNTKVEKANKIPELREKPNVNLKTKVVEKVTGTIKDRLGVTNNNKSQKQLINKTQETTEYRNAKCLEQNRDALINSKNIKNRLGPLKNNFRPVSTKPDFNTPVGRSQSSEDDDCLNLGAEEELDDDAQSLVNTGPIKSHIIAIKKSSPVKTGRKRLKSTEKSRELSKVTSSDGDEEDVEDSKLPSKVIVTPRPLKPLQPTQKRATQSLLLRAVAEANQSVVTQKNPEPSLLDKKPVLKRLKPPANREVGQNLSVHFNASKRLVMEKIQVELNTTESSDMKSKPYVPQAVNDDHMGVVMSLFQRSDDNQKFVVTLNGYNNNLGKEKTTSDDEERLEMEVNEDDELALLTNQNDSYIKNELSSDIFRITDAGEDVVVASKERHEENNENCNTENVDKIEDVPRKRRKLSPIVYNRSHSPSPVDLKSNALLPNLTKRTDKKPLAESSLSVIADKSREKCRYWPNCTLGNKCAYLHPVLMCSAFPACKFGDKCAYKHPKCKFGLSCTKLGCVFSHPVQQCKFHPFCTKPACPYSHPPPPAALSVEPTSQRAKFTWRKRD